LLINAITSADEATKAPVLKALGCKGEWSTPAWPLPNLKEASERDFWGWRSSYSFKVEIWTGQLKIDGRWANLMIYWVGHSQFIGGGFAVAYFHQYQKEEVRYYEWRACEHEFTEKNIGNCLHRYTCKKCGEAYDVDSSG
jgi:hypothetical protein